LFLQALDQFQSKMERTKQQIKEEQNSRDENVDEYLRLSSCADRQQLSRIKQVMMLPVMMMMMKMKMAMMIIMLVMMIVTVMPMILETTFY